MRFANYLIGLIVVGAIGLSGCGGGGGSAGTSATAVVTTPIVVTPTTPAVTVPVAADFVFQLDKITLVNTGGDKALLTVSAVDSSRNVVAGVPVSVVLDSDGVFAPLAPVTDATGSFSGNITIGGNRANRTINATISVSGIVKVASVVVTGSQISITPSTSTPTPGQRVDIGMVSKASDGSAIQNSRLTLSGSAGATGVVVTDASGVATSGFNAPSAAGDYTVVVSGLGITKSLTLKVVPLGGVGIDAAIGTIRSASLSPQPTTIAPNISGASTNRSTLAAKFLTDGNVAVKNMRVRFVIAEPSLGGGESLSSTATVFSDVNGVAQVDYIAGTRSSPTNGVTVFACYSPVDFTVAVGCPPATSAEYREIRANLTVAGTPLSITIGTDNTSSKGLGGIAYIKQFLIQVNDAAGVAIKDAIVTASVDITHYGKGVYGGLYPKDPSLPSIVDTSLAFSSDGISVLTAPQSNSVAPFFRTILLNGVTTTTNYNVWCANEDVNRNGFLESNERVNGNDTIEPRKAEVIVSYVSGNKTDANGQLLIQVSYAQNMAGWLAYTIRATTGVEGSEGDASKSFMTVALQEDVANGSFLRPPFGSGACNSVN